MSNDFARKEEAWTTRTFTADPVPVGKLISGSRCKTCNNPDTEDNPLLEGYCERRCHPGKSFQGGA